MQKNNIKGSLILLLAALLWGMAFVVQCEAADKISPFAFNGIRCILGSFVLSVFLIISNKMTIKKFKKIDKKVIFRNILIGLVCGIILMFAVNFQQCGISYYPKDVSASARSGFITALYVILVPIFSVFIKKKISLTVWLGVIIAMIGIYLLCLKNGFHGIYLGDYLMFGCAVTFAFHILFVDKFCTSVNGVVLSMLQFLFCGIFSLMVSFAFETPTTTDIIIDAFPQILYMSIVSCGMAYTLQIIGQKYAEPAVASISMSFEGVFAALGGWIFLKDSLDSRELLGCVLVFVAVVIAQMPTPKFLTKRN